MKSYTFLLNFTATEVICLFFLDNNYLFFPLVRFWQYLQCFVIIFRDVNSRSREKHRPTGISTNTTRCRENGVWKMDWNRNMRKKLSPESSCISASSVSNTYSHLWALLVEFSSSSSFILLLGWPDLHLSELQRVLPTGPGWPLDAVGIWGVLAAQVLSVEVGGVAIAVPPGAVVEGCAVILRVVVVLVLSGEFHAAVFEQRVACSVGSMRDGKKDWGR